MSRDIYYDKGLKGSYSKSDSFSQSKLHHQVYQIPPWTQEHLRAIVLQYINSSHFVEPAHQDSLWETIKTFYKNTKNVQVYMKDLQIKQVLQELNKQRALEITEQALGTKLVLYIDRVNKSKIKQLLKTYEGDLPTTQPPDPIVFANSKLNASTISKENQAQYQKLIKTRSIFERHSQQNKELESLSQIKSIAQNTYVQQFKKKMQNNSVQYCDHCTKERCMRIKGRICNQKHFRKIIKSNTQQSSGNCPHLNACLNPDCKHIHYAEEGDTYSLQDRPVEVGKYDISDTQWINCDLRYFDFRVLGKFNAVMADPPWDIHMQLPYGTLKDKQMLNLRVDLLQDQGVIFLWVTGRAMEIGRQCLLKWGYKRVEQLVWIKTNQLNRLIITGRTGHWLNHTKQHCLIGIKGNPRINKNVDCDVLVAKVRQTSRKPDEIYSLIQRMCPGGKKIELFGRPHNCKPGWVTLGNQLPGLYIKDQQILKNYKMAYPDQHQQLTEQTMLNNLIKMQSQEHLHQVYNNHIVKTQSTGGN